MKTANTTTAAREDLVREKTEILNWMNEMPHPSQFRVWSVMAERTSKEWTKKELRLKEIMKELEIVF
jgi:predicted Fe-S protein YdhL (DUF1289 family)